MMTGDEQDRYLKQAMQELREEERRSAPAFRPGLARPAVDKDPRSLGQGWVWLAATLVLIATGVGWTTLQDLNRRPGGQVAATLSTTKIETWESPTGRLLRTAGRDLTGELPRLGAFPFQSLDSASARTKNPGPAPHRN